MSKVVVVGGGVMGQGIAEAVLACGYSVVMIVRDLSKAVESRFKVTNQWEEVKGADYIVEAVSESVEAKKLVLEKVSVINQNAVLASTTSAIPIVLLSQFCKEPSRFIGLHFFNPAPRMESVEVIPGPLTAENTISASIDWVRTLNKVPVLVKDGPGFVTTRLLLAYFAEALRMVEEGHSPQSIDEAMVKCVKMPMGPCALMDLIGFDVLENIFQQLEKELGLHFSSPIFFKKWLNSQKLGKKSGEGFYGYSRKGATRP